uniref:Uncharacterized protein n=1 Tax=Sphaerodactylus townsendi TaxID=933632 RepID=A0ACB8E7N0_9SAUR
MQRLLCCASIMMGHSRLCTLHFWVCLNVVPAHAPFHVSTSEISNSPEDDATQIPMSQMSGAGALFDTAVSKLWPKHMFHHGSTPMPMMELTSPERENDC